MLADPSKDATKKTQKAALKRAVEKAEAEAGGGEPSAKKPKGEPSASAEMLPVPEGQGWKSCFTCHIPFRTKNLLGISFKHLPSPG